MGSIVPSPAHAPLRAQLCFHGIVLHAAPGQ